MEKKYLQKQRQGEQWSSMKFPHEVVTEAEMGLWQRAIAQVVRNGPAQINLGAFKTNGHKLWEWQVLEPQGHLFQKCRDQVEVYGHLRQGWYTHLCTSCSGRMRGAVATVEEVALGTVKVYSVVSPQSTQFPRQTSLMCCMDGRKRGFETTSK